MRRKSDIKARQPTSKAARSKAGQHQCSAENENANHPVYDGRKPEQRMSVGLVLMAVRRRARQILI